MLRVIIALTLGLAGWAAAQTPVPAIPTRDPLAPLPPTTAPATSAPMIPAPVTIAPSASSRAPTTIAPKPAAPAASSPLSIAPIIKSAPVARPMPLATPGFYPATDYITAGQDEPGYRYWIASDPNRPALVKSFNAYLVAAGVGGVAPTWQLLRTASQWQRCGAQPFEVPPTDGWPNIVAALRYVGAFVMPKIGPVEPVSVYRNPALNRCAGGAAESTHRTVGAIDMVPLHRTTREELMLALCQLHLDSGTWNSIGLGLYKGIRFHIDAKKFREWGTQGARGDWGCDAVLAEGAMPFHESPVLTAGSSEAAPILTQTPVAPLPSEPKS